MRNLILIILVCISTFGYSQTRWEEKEILVGIENGIVKLSTDGSNVLIEYQYKSEVGIIEEQVILPKLKYYELLGAMYNSLYTKTFYIYTIHLDCNIEFNFVTIKGLDSYFIMFYTNSTNCGGIVTYSEPISRKELNKIIRK